MRKISNYEKYILFLENMGVKLLGYQKQMLKYIIENPNVKLLCVPSSDIKAKDDVMEQMINLLKNKEIKFINVDLAEGTDETSIYFKEM